MKLAVMQPYFLPYIGYFQLLAAVDKFVILDDVSYINRGWINRNRIATRQGPQWMTVPLTGASQNRLINELDIAPDDGWKRKLSRTVSMAYADAERSDPVMAQFGEWMAAASGNLSRFLRYCIESVAAELGIPTAIVPSASTYRKAGLRGQDRILDICKREGATMYVNPPGGRDLYDAEAFAAAGIELRFLDSLVGPGTVKHGGSEGPVLSIVDLLMHNPLASLRQALRLYELDPAVVTPS